MITYVSNSLDDLKQFADSSISCRQFTRFDCRSMTLYYGYLMDRNRNIMKYFGGGLQDGHGMYCQLKL